MLVNTVLTHDGSYVQSDWCSSEVYGDHEVIKLTREAATNQPIDAGDEHGDDEGE